MSTRHTLMFLTLALAAGPALAQQDISKVNGSIDAQSGQTHGALETVNGSIRIDDGAVTGDAETVNGSIRVGDKARTGALETVNGGVRLGRDVSVDGGIETVNGEIFVDRGGRVRGGAITVNGSIGLVGTQLGGGIETVRGDITVGADSVVKGGLKVQKSSGMFNIGNNRVPRIVIGPNGVVEGPLVFEREVKLYVHRTARTGAITGATARPYEGDRPPQD